MSNVTAARSAAGPNKRSARQRQRKIPAVYMRGGTSKGVFFAPIRCRTIRASAIACCCA